MTVDNTRESKAFSPQVNFFGCRKLRLELLRISVIYPPEIWWRFYWGGDRRNYL